MAFEEMKDKVKAEIAQLQTQLMEQMEITSKIERLQGVLAAFDGHVKITAKKKGKQGRTGKRGKMSEAGKAKIAASQAIRWAKQKGAPAAEIKRLEAAYEKLKK